MTIAHKDYDAIADVLWDARRECTTVVPPSARFATFDLADGYAVGAQLQARRLDAGDRRAGLKVGFTNMAVWTKFGLAEPICAAVYDSTVRHVSAADREISVDTSRLVVPAIEPEIVLGIGEHGPDWWALGFEIVHCHYKDWHMTPADALADGGLHGALVIGRRIPFVRERHALGAPFEIELLRNGVHYEGATTDAVLGGPLHVLDRANEICARTPELAALQPGDVVTTGSLTSAPRIAPGERWTVRADNDAPPLEILVR
jgi:2-keto-4-pentenoate hydratase